VIHKDIVLTFDYELFGDGSGDVFTDVIKPTNSILDHCAQRDIKVTIFVEIIEFIKLREEWVKGNRMGYVEDPIKAITTQLQMAALNGHDIQLHIHPQWVNAKYEDGNWIVDFDNWRLGDFSSTKYTLKDLLLESKNELEKLIKPIIPSYECVALRAGGYNIMPSVMVYSAMKEVGLKLDSSVYPGGYENSSLSRFDYRSISIQKAYWWGNKKDIRESSTDKMGVLEIPIFALPIKRWKKYFTFSKIKTLLFSKSNNVSALSKEKIKDTSIYEKLKFLFEEEAFTWDVCMFSSSMHKHYFKFIETKLKDKRDFYVLIGHPKSLSDEKLFKSFIDIVHNRKQQYRLKTLIEKYAEIVG